MQNNKELLRLYMILSVVISVLFLSNALIGCTSYIPVERDPELTKPIKKIPPRNRHGEPFGPGITWQDYETALIEQWKEVDDGNERLNALKNIEQ